MCPGFRSAWLKNRFTYLFVSKQEWELPTKYTDPIHNKPGQRLNVGLCGIVYVEKGFRCFRKFIY